jgi:DNA-binding LacI/PurR family transcriptional regulator
MNREIALGEKESRRRPTIADVARRAGVSPAAVSFAVNDRPGVADQTRARILVAAKELGWQPSASARALTEARTRAIGLVLARRADQLELDSFFVRFLSGVERTLAPADYALLLQLVSAVDADDALRAYERLAAGGRVDGFLLTDPELADPRFPLLEAAGLPVVVAGSPVAGTPFLWLETAHDLGVAAAVEHLAGLGHERIAFLGGVEAYEHVQRRLARWRMTMSAAGLDPAGVVFAGEELGAGAAAVLDRDPTAVVCTSDTLAMAVVAAGLERGLQVPRDVSVTGFDDSLLAELSPPGLTSVRVDYAEFGMAAAAALLAAIDGAEPPVFNPSAPKLVVRASTARRPSAEHEHRIKTGRAGRAPRVPGGEQRGETHRRRRES